MKRSVFVGIGLVLSVVASLFVSSTGSGIYHQPEIPEELLKRK